MFLVLDGDLTFRCGADTFDVGTGGFVFLPRGLEHGYKIRSGGDFRLLVITAPSDPAAVGGWGGFVADIERSGDPVRTPAPSP